MDDGGTLTRTRTRCQVLKMKVRQVVQNMHAIVHGLKLRLALKKTLIGRISKGFDFWGYRFGALGLAGLAQQTIDNYQQRLLRLYEPGASDPRVEKYVSNWLRWTVSGLTRVCNGFARSQHLMSEALRVYGSITNEREIHELRHNTDTNRDINLPNTCTCVRLHYTGSCRGGLPKVDVH
jgi:hypothetical protein